MKKLFLTFILMVGALTMLSAQPNNKLWGTVEVSYGYSFAEKKDAYGIGYPQNNSVSFLQAILGYYVSEKLSLGVGIGLNGYSNPGLNTIPLFLDLRFHPLQNKKMILNGSVGYSLSTNETNLGTGALASISIGYNLFKIKKISIVPAIGYNYCQYTVTDTNGITHNSNRNSLFVKLGIVY